MFKPTTLLLLLVTVLVGCNSLGLDDYRRGQRSNNRGYNQRGYDNRRSADRSYPAWARTYDKNGRTAYVLCHKNKKTKVVRTNSVRGHLRHGDRFGSCYSDRRTRNRRYDNRRYDNRRYDDDDDDGYRRRHDDDDD